MCIAPGVIELRSFDAATECPSFSNQEWSYHNKFRASPIDLWLSDHKMRNYMKAAEYDVAQSANHNPGFTIEENLVLVKVGRRFLTLIKALVDFEVELAGANN